MTNLVPENEVKEIAEQTRDIVQVAENSVIETEQNLVEASDMLSYIAKTKKAIEEKRKFFVKPLNDQVKRINEMFKGYAAPLEKADGIMRKKVLVYRQEQDRKRRAEEEALRKLQEKEQKRLERLAKKNGDVAPPPPIITPFIPQQEKTVQSDLGAVSAKMVWEFEIVDENKIPNEFKIVNEKAIRAAVKAGVRNIPGVKIYQTETLAVKSR